MLYDFFLCYWGEKHREPSFVFLSKAGAYLCGTSQVLLSRADYLPNTGIKVYRISGPVYLTKPSVTEKKKVL
jgi:hypothetical protein